MNALPINGVSGPVQTRFGLPDPGAGARRTVDIEMKQLRDQARSCASRSSMRAHKDWVAELPAPRPSSKSGNGWTEAGPRTAPARCSTPPKARRPASRRA